MTFYYLALDPLPIFSLSAFKILNLITYDNKFKYNQ